MLTEQTAVFFLRLMYVALAALPTYSYSYMEADAHFPPRINQARKRKRGGRAKLFTHSPQEGWKLALARCLRKLPHKELLRSYKRPALRGNCDKSIEIAPSTARKGWFGWLVCLNLFNAELSPKRYQRRRMRSLEVWEEGGGYT